MLAFVIRDKTKTPMEKLQEILLEDVQAIWSSIEKPASYKDAGFRDLFDTHFIGLPSYELSEQAFTEACEGFRQLFSTDCLLPPDGSKIPGSGFALDLGNMWDMINKNRDINIPAHRILVAQMRCGQVAREQAEAFQASEAWRSLRSQCEASIEAGADMGPRLEDIYLRHAEAYQEETQLFDAEVREHYRMQLAEDIFSQALQLFHDQLDRWMKARVAAIQKRAGDFGRGEFARRLREEVQAAKGELRDVLGTFVPDSAPWSANQYHESGSRKLDRSAQKISDARVLREVEQVFESHASSCSTSLRQLLFAPGGGFWDKATSICTTAGAQAKSELETWLAGFELSAEDAEKVRAEVDRRAWAVLDAFLAQCLANLGGTLREVFMELFVKDEAGAVRSWKPGEDIKKLGEDARMAAASMLAALCVDQRDVAQETRLGLERSVVDFVVENAGLRGAPRPKHLSGVRPLVDLTAAHYWDGVPGGAVRVPPSLCRSTWRQFVQDTSMGIQSAIATQEAKEMASRRAPPLWALAAMVVLGWNEAMALLRSPLALLGVAAVVYLLWSLYREVDLDHLVQERGWVGGLVSVGAKIHPALNKVCSNMFETARRITEDPASAIRSAQRQGMRRKAEASDAVEMSRQGAGGTGSRSSHPAAAQAGTNGHGNGATGSDETTFVTGQGWTDDSQPMPRCLDWDAVSEESWADRKSK